MRNTFVKTSNVQRFLTGMGQVEERGAPEACFLLCVGDAGHGKSRTGQWWGVQNGAVRVRLKAAATAHWFLTDLVRELGEVPTHTCERLFAQSIESLVRDPRPIVVDEIENGLARDLAVVETIRDVADLVEVPVVLIGRDYVRAKLKRQRQIWTRISAVVEFTAATRADVALCCAELAEVKVSGDLVDEITKQSEGYIREVVKAIKNVERVGLRLKGEVVELDDMRGAPLTQEWQRRGPHAKAA